MRTPFKRRPSGTCPQCGTWRYSLHRDHIVPKFKGGSDDTSNHQYICANCHEDKSRIERIGARVFTAEHRAKIGAAKRGTKASAETRAKMSASHVGMTGRLHTEASKEKMRVSSRRRWDRAAALKATA